MDLNSKLALLIEALRGGNVPSGERGPPTVRRMANGAIQRHPMPYGSSGAGMVGGMMPTQLRDYQLHNQEAAAMGQPGISYSDWMAQKGQ